MPIYEYLCEKCGREFEREQRISDAPVRTCPHCRSRRVKKLISRTSFVLKGGGWYSDLYASAKPGGASKESDSSSGTEAASSDAKSEKSDKSDKAEKAEKTEKVKAAPHSDKGAKSGKKKPRRGASGKSAA
jgi:putative FmdB family regulatory protein